jgi:hypothetical protein
MRPPVVSKLDVNALFRAASAITVDQRISNQINRGELMTTQALPAAAIPTALEVLVILTPRQGVTVQQVMTVLPAEMRATVKLYLDGKIRQWYSRGDGNGVLFLLQPQPADAARANMDNLPLAKEQTLDHHSIPAGPLLPLRKLLGTETKQ